MRERRWRKRSGVYGAQRHRRTKHCRKHAHEAGCAVLRTARPVCVRPPACAAERVYALTVVCTRAKAGRRCGAKAGRGEQMSGLGEAVAVGVVLGVAIGAGAALLGVFVGLRAVARWYRQWIDGK